MKPEYILWRPDIRKLPFEESEVGSAPLSCKVLAWQQTGDKGTKTAIVQSVWHLTEASSLPELSCGFGSGGPRRGERQCGGPAAKHHLDCFKRTVRKREKAKLQVYHFQSRKGSQRAKRSEFFMADRIKPRGAIKLLLWCDVILSFLLLGF